MQVNPGTKVTVLATFTKGGGPGKFQPPSSCVSNNTKDSVGTSVDDGAAGTSATEVDGSQNGTGDSSIFTVSGDADLGKGIQTVSGVSEQVDWTDAVDIEADGVQISVNQPVASSAAQKSDHTKALRGG